MSMRCDVADMYARKAHTSEGVKERRCRLVVINIIHPWSQSLKLKYFALTM